MPIIGVAWPQPDYLSALEHAGATPRLLDPRHDALPVSLDACDGVLLTGGADVDPSHYGAAERHETLKLDAARDAYELVIAREAMARDMPLLAICRGVQLLNVAAGGTLIQDIPTQRPGAVVHSLREPPTRTPHVVSIRPDSRLATLLAAAGPLDRLPVNSRHHQCVDRVAPTFAVSAVAPDGIVEGVERPTAHFCIGVQWHPENFWKTGEFGSLFRGFVESARGWREQHPSSHDSATS